MEEKLSSIYPQIALQSTSNAQKKSNKPQKLRKTQIPGYYSVLAWDLTSTCSWTDDIVKEDERSNLAPILSDPATDYTLTNSEPDKIKPHAFKPDNDEEKDSQENDRNSADEWHEWQDYDEF